MGRIPKGKEWLTGWIPFPHNFARGCALCNLALSRYPIHYLDEGLLREVMFRRLNGIERRGQIHHMLRASRGLRLTGARQGNVLVVLYG